ncbi:hypothetical protein S13e_00010 [Klebsiella phage VLCpiS13e]|uniref:hypothetical protein n=1 Tax=Klebsiella phage VLCpiS13e TaxID=2874889 RepID=UPI00233F5211|nr:hypothetical protein PRB82_gp10 [Klebsiella phage VLCpiS13e]UVX31596.1 hypothetical protein S13e_00010 [Klebsiella phage VLCpiS13e]
MSRYLIKEDRKTGFVQLYKEVKFLFFFNIWQPVFVKTDGIFAETNFRTVDAARLKIKEIETIGDSNYKNRYFESIIDTESK